MTRDIVAALQAEELAMDEFMSDQSEEKRQEWVDKKAVVESLMAS
jgi:hypothetical protein